jgi:Putative bacterial sensory transduction regulator
VTLILAPGLGLVAWAHYAPPLGDSFRKTYRRLLRWNDELPFVKFAISEDERIMLTAEVPAVALDRDALGRTLARLVAVCDLLRDESASFLGDWAKAPASAPTTLLDRYATDIAELEAPADPDAPADLTTDTIEAQPGSATAAGSAVERGS